MHTLITGSNGFTGGYMRQLLEKENFPVLGLSYEKHATNCDILCDLSDLAAVKSVVAEVKPTYVIHLAALSFVAQENHAAYYHTNLFGTQNLLEALSTLSTPPKKILIPSSANIYGALEENQLSESTCPIPVNHYGMSKLVMECMARTWFDRLPIVITRPFNYTGPGQDTRFLVPKIVDHFKRQASTIELGNTNVSRDFLDVRDVVSIYLQLLKSPIHSEIINICSGESVPVRTIIQRMNQIAGYDIDIKVNPDFIRRTEISRLVGDNAKLKQLLRFTPQFTLEQTLQYMYESSL